MPTFEESQRDHKLSQLRHKEEEDTVRMLSEKHKIPYADLAIVPVNVDALGLVPE